MIFYMHPNGQADFRKPVRLSVGPYHYKFPDGREVFDPDMKNLPSAYEYQQLQIESGIK
jgi:hypothetical protein